MSYHKKITPMLERLKVYENTFGHPVPPEVKKAYDLETQVEMVEEALAKGEPYMEWAKRAKTKTGSIMDKFYS